MARANLAAALQRADEETQKTSEPEAGEAQTAEQLPSRVPPVPASKKKPEAVHAGSPEPLYSSLERKETRLREDQLTDLAAHARRLQRTKSFKGGERITDNTLIRIAIDLLLATKAEDLAGNNEAELRGSLGL